MCIGVFSCSRFSTKDLPVTIRDAVRIEIGRQMQIAQANGDGGRRIALVLLQEKGLQLLLGMDCDADCARFLQDKQDDGFGKAEFFISHR